MNVLLYVGRIESSATSGGNGQNSVSNAALAEPAVLHDDVALGVPLPSSVSSSSSPSSQNSMPLNQFAPDALLPPFAIQVQRAATNPTQSSPSKSTSSLLSRKRSRSEDIETHMYGNNKTNTSLHPEEPPFFAISLVAEIFFGLGDVLASHKANTMREHIRYRNIGGVEDGSSQHTLSALQDKFRLTEFQRTGGGRDVVFVHILVSSWPMAFSWVRKCSIVHA